MAPGQRPELNQLFFSFFFSSGMRQSHDILVGEMLIKRPERRWEDNIKIGGLLWTRKRTLWFHRGGGRGDRLLKYGAVTYTNNVKYYFGKFCLSSARNPRFGRNCGSAALIQYPGRTRDSGTVMLKKWVPMAKKTQHITYPWQRSIGFMLFSENHTNTFARPNANFMNVADQNTFGAASYLRAKAEETWIKLNCTHRGDKETAQWSVEAVVSSVRWGRWRTDRATISFILHLPVASEQPKNNPYVRNNACYTACAWTWANSFRLQLVISVTTSFKIMFRPPQQTD